MLGSRGTLENPKILVSVYISYSSTGQESGRRTLNTRLQARRHLINARQEVIWVSSTSCTPSIDESDDGPLWAFILYQKKADSLEQPAFTSVTCKRLPDIVMILLST